MLTSCASWKKKSVACAVHSLSGAFLTWVYLSVIFVAIPTSLSLIVVWVGVPMLLGTFALIRSFAGLERRLAVQLFELEIAPPPKVSEMHDSRWRQIRVLLTHGATWRGLGYLAIRWLTGLISFVVTVALGSVSLALLLVPFIDGLMNFNDNWSSSAGWQSWWAVPVGLACFAVMVALLAAIGHLHRFIAPSLLGPSSADEIRVLQGRAAKLDAQTQLARDLHDSVGHTMTSVVVQAGAARRVFDTNPAFAREALQDIEQSARRALDELDYMIGVLRNDRNVATTRSPLPTLLDVDRLVLTSRRNGVNLTHSIVGDVAAVPEVVSREAFRIIQEGLTNLTRHAPQAPGQLVVTIGASQVEIALTNPLTGGGDTTRSSGRGLVGIGERVSALGGVMWSGPIEDVYVLRTVLPFSAAFGGAR